MLAIDHLTYRYNRHTEALSDVSARINPGICLVLGQNGAGKTTLLNLCSGGIFPTGGTVHFDSENPSLRQPSTLSRIFFLPSEYCSPFRNINDAAEYHAPFYPRFSRLYFEENLMAFGLTGKEKLRSLSLGMLHKANIAFALALRPELLLLDEPANGLDINSKKELRRMVSRCVDEEQTVLISTHTVADLEVLYDSVLLLDHGHVLLNASTAAIADSLAFVKSSEPLPQALYIENDCGAFRMILPSDGTEQTNIDYELLYSALLSESRQSLLTLLNAPL